MLMDWSFVFIKDLDFEPASLQEVSRVSFVRFDDIFYSAESDCSRKFFKCCHCEDSFKGVAISALSSWGFNGSRKGLR